MDDNTPTKQGSYIVNRTSLYAALQTIVKPSLLWRFYGVTISRTSGLHAERGVARGISPCETRRDQSSRYSDTSHPSVQEMLLSSCQVLCCSSAQSSFPLRTDFARDTTHSLLCNCESRCKPYGTFSVINHTGVSIDKN